jgi:3-oxoadipate enol-lactonase
MRTETSLPFATAEDGVRIYFEETGKGEQPPLLLVSGQGLDHGFWSGVRDDLADRFRVIAYDNRGTGQSDKPRSPPYSTRSFAKDAVAILDHLGIDRAHAYGHSMGGRICQWLAIDHGGRVGGLVLGATTPGNAHGAPRPAEVVEMLTHVPSDPAEVFKVAAGLSLSPAWSEAHPDEAREFLKPQAMPDYARLMHHQASEGHDAWDLLPTIRSPTLVIHGSDDVINPTKNAYLLAGRIPGAELYIVQGARHAYVVDFQEESDRVVGGFLARHPLS